MPFDTNRLWSPSSSRWASPSLGHTLRLSVGRPVGITWRHVSYVPETYEVIAQVPNTHTLRNVCHEKHR